MGDRTDGARPRPRFASPNGPWTRPVVHGGSTRAPGGLTGRSQHARAPSTGRLYGGNGPDRLHGEAGNDLIRGGDGNDLIRGGGGLDRIYAGYGRDVIIVAYDKTADAVDCGPGWDVVTYGPGDVVSANCERRIKVSQ